MRTRRHRGSRRRTAQRRAALPSGGPRAHPLTARRQPRTPAQHAMSARNARDSCTACLERAGEARKRRRGHSAPSAEVCGPEAPGCFCARARTARRHGGTWSTRSARNQGVRTASKCEIRRRRLVAFQRSASLQAARLPRWSQQALWRMTVRVAALPSAASVFASPAADSFCPTELSHTLPDSEARRRATALRRPGSGGATPRAVGTERAACARRTACRTGCFGRGGRTLRAMSRPL